MRDLGFATSEAGLEHEILEALGERTRLVRASISAILLGLLALLFAANAIAVTMGITTASIAGRITLGGALLLVAAEIGVIAYNLHHPDTPQLPQSAPLDLAEPPARRTG